jgi:hypothetical protein
MKRVLTPVIENLVIETVFHIFTPPPRRKLTIYPQGVPWKVR